MNKCFFTALFRKFNSTERICSSIFLSRGRLNYSIIHILLVFLAVKQKTGKVRASWVEGTGELFEEITEEVGI